MGLTPHARQLPGALFVRRLRFRLVKNENETMQSFFLLHHLSVANASGLLIIKLLDFSLILLSVPDAFGA